MIRLRLFPAAFAIALGTAGAARAQDPASDNVRLIIKSARSQIGVTLGYDPAYRKLAYPGGDVPLSSGVCTDVVIRAYRGAGVDLQKLVHEDMKAQFASYPSRRIWGLSAPDKNIDHRRVPNLETFFARFGKSFGVDLGAHPPKPGDLLTWEVPPALPHIGIVSDRMAPDGKEPLIIHNIGQGAQEEEVIGRFKLTGHYRYTPR